MFDFIQNIHPTVLDFAGTSLTMIGLYFYVINNRIAWHFSNAGLLPYTLLFFAVAMWPLFALQVLFIAFGIHGYILWLLMDRNSKYVEAWRMLTPLMALACAVVAGVWTDFSQGAWAFVQLSIVLFSIVASYGLAQRYTWSWLVWLPANALGFVYYYHTDLPFLMWAQIPLFVFSVVGYFRWRREDKKKAMLIEPIDNTNGSKGWTTG